MSVIAWDGKHLVADRQATCAGMRATVSKMCRLETGEVLAWTGEHEHGLALVRWYQGGAKRDEWPEFQKGDDWTRLIVAKPDGVVFFEKQPEPQAVVDVFMAWGSGRDYAMGAMAIGADAKRAVEIASMFDVNCGCGCEVYRPGAE